MRRLVLPLLVMAGPAAAACAQIYGIEPTERAPMLDGATEDAQAEAAERDAAALTALPTAGLVAAWSFEVSGGPYVKSDVLTADGTAHSGLVTDGSAVAEGGVRGSCVTFRSGTRGFLVDTLAYAEFPQRGTLSLWVRSELVESGATRGVFDVIDETRDHLFLRQLGTAEPGLLQFTLQGAGDAGYAFAGQNVKLDYATWTHIAMIWGDPAGDTSARAQIFQNGIGSTAQYYDTRFSPRNQLMQLGKDYVGAIDEIRLYARALSLEEIRLLSDAGSYR